MIIFLDFDGVLHPEPCRDPEKLLAELLRVEGILRDFQQAQIVVTSTWRHSRTIKDFRDLFSPLTAMQIVGLTPRWQDLDETVYSYHRQAEVEAWLRTHRAPWDEFVILDDKPWLFSPFYPRLLKCNPSTGMDDQVEVTVRALISACART